VNDPHLGPGPVWYSRTSWRSPRRDRHARCAGVDRRNQRIAWGIAVCSRRAGPLSRVNTAPGRRCGTLKRPDAGDHQVRMTCRQRPITRHGPSSRRLNARVNLPAMDRARPRGRTAESHAWVSPRLCRSSPGAPTIQVPLSTVCTWRGRNIGYYGLVVRAAAARASAGMDQRMRAGLRERVAVGHNPRGATCRQQQGGAGFLPVLGSAGRPRRAARIVEMIGARRNAVEDMGDAATAVGPGDVVLPVPGARPGRQAATR
jgi:hypothetical protein